MRRKTVAARLFLATLCCAPAVAPAQETIAYRYDALGRLVGTTSSGAVNSGLTTSIGYDAAGNRQSYGVSGAGSGGGSGGSSGGGGGGGGTAMPVVANFSFEAPALGGSGYQNRPTGTGVTFAGWSGVTSNSSDWGYAAAPDGGQVAFFNSWPEPTSVTMAVTGLTPGAAYRVRFMSARRLTYTPLYFRVTVDGAVLGLYLPASTSFTAVTTSPFTATGPTATLVFEGVEGGDAALDNVTVGP
jgi:hypothetical protein